MNIRPCVVLCCLVGMLSTLSLPALAEPLSIGLARRDITPDYPVRLTGYSNRTKESEGVAQKLWAKALAIGSGDDAAVIVTVDNLGIAASQTDEVAARLKRYGLSRERLVIAASHAHTAPYLPRVAALIFEPPLPADHVAHSEQYQRELIEHLVAVAAAALDDRRPSELAATQGSARFAMNRRKLADGRSTGIGVAPGGPVDHALPILRVTDEQGKVRGIVVNYACHCTTLGPSFNQLCGDWAGYAQEYLERDYPGAVAMVMIGCGADANPEPRDGGRGLELSQQHGEAIAKGVRDQVAGPWTKLTQSPRCQLAEIQLPFATHPTRAEFSQRAEGRGPIAWHARTQLARLDRGESLPTTLPYRVQSWQFGDGLMMVFLAGEVVVDYALRLKRELNNDRLWITAYANDDPCYIASKRVLLEGGYEVDSSMYYYDRPTRFAPETEDLIIAAVLKQLRP